LAFITRIYHDARSSEYRKSKNQKSMKKCDTRISPVSNKPHTIYISSNNDRHPVAKTFTPLQCTCRHFTSSHLNFNQVHFTTLQYPLFWLNPFKFSLIVIFVNILILGIILPRMMYCCLCCFVFEPSIGRCLGEFLKLKYSCPFVCICW